MAFFDNLSKMITQTSQDVAKKTKTFADTNKINNLISEEQRIIAAQYHKIGNLYYNMYKDAPAEEMREMIAIVEQSFAKIQQYRDQLAELNNLQKCPACGADIPLDARFCNACGAKIPEKTVPEQPAEESAPVQEVPAANAEPMVEAPKEVPTEKVCPQCGSRLAAGDSFCSECGSLV